MFEFIYTKKSLLVKQTYMSIGTYDIHRNTHTMMYKDMKLSVLINGKTVV